MSEIGQKERATQKRVIALFTKELGYRYLGNWEDRENNSNIEEKILRGFLAMKGYNQNLIGKALYEFGKVAGDQSKSLYDVNKEVYTMLRYGVNVQPETGQNKETVWLIDWKNPLENDFAIAEEVTIKGFHKKRPDLVLYVNGIALGVLELKRSTVSISEGIRQNNDNQKHIFIKPFFSTIQLVMAGNNVEGLAYAAIDTKEKYFLKWKEMSDQAASHDYLLDLNIVQLLNKERLIELVHDFVVFDRGQKKLCRPNQYFGIKAAQKFVKNHENGILWHTQGSGKSLSMVFYAGKLVLAEEMNNPTLVVLTDRNDLDQQLYETFSNCQQLLRQAPVQAANREDLKKLLSVASGGIVFTTIQKFLPEENGGVYPTLTERRNVVVIADEAHRS